MSEWPSAQSVREQEAMTALPTFGQDEAVDLGLVILGLARERSLPVVIEVRVGDFVAFRAGLPGSSTDNDAWVEGKAKVVARFGHSSLHERLHHQEAGRTFAEGTGLDEDTYRAHGGAVPLRIQGDDAVVGVAIVSGLPQLEDHALVVEGLQSYLSSR